MQERAQTLFAKKRGPKPVDGPGEPDRLHGEIGRPKGELEGDLGSSAAYPGAP